MVSVIEAVTALRPTGPIIFEDAEGCTLKELRASGDWAAYAARLEGMGGLKQERGKREWCAAQGGGVTMFLLWTNGLEVAAANYNELAASCATLLLGLRVGPICECVPLVLATEQRLMAFDKTMEIALPGGRREAVNNRLPVLFTRAWVAVVKAGLCDIRQIIACQLATDANASEETRIALLLGSLVSAAQVHAWLVKLTTRRRTGDYSWDLLGAMREGIYAEYDLRVAETPGIQGLSIEPVVVGLSSE